MDQRQQPQPGQGEQAMPTNTHGYDPSGGSHQGINGAQGHSIPAHLMGLMANPALAAAAAAAPLMPTAAILTNPGAFLTMPDMMTGNNSQLNSGAVAQGSATAPGGVVLPHIAASLGASHQSLVAAYSDGTGNQQGNQMGLQPVQHMGQGQQQQPGNTGSIPIASLPPNASSAVQTQIAAAGTIPNGSSAQHSGQSVCDDKNSSRNRRTDLTPEERAKQNRDRNREHARSTRLRKKAYVQKLKELVEGLHAERTEEVRQRRVAIQHLSEMQNVRRAVVRSFLRFHSNYEKDHRKWSTILEETFWLKQPVTPYRCFRRSEIENECRISRGIESVIADAASVAVMIEGVGSRSTRWMQIKQEDFFLKEEERTGSKLMPRDILRQSNRFQHAVSSLSSSSGSSNGGSGGEEGQKQWKQNGKQSSTGKATGCGNGDEKKPSARDQSSKDYHDYHAQPLPDPKLADSERSSPGEDSPEESSNSAEADTKRVSTDSSSGDDSAAAIKMSHSAKRRKGENGQVLHQSGNSSFPHPEHLPPNIAKKGGITHNVRPVEEKLQALRNGNARLSTAPAIALPPFAGIGKRPQVPPDGQPTTGSLLNNNLQGQAQPLVVGAAQNASSDRIADQSSGEKIGDNAPANASVNGPAVISGDFETSSSNSSRQRPQIRSYYHVNEDDMILMENILMCPFIFRTQDAVLCGALAECVMPGMLRGHFSTRNKLQSLEMIYDAMGFMQQLERASGSEMTAQIIPGSLEMALSPTSHEPRVITLASPPFLIVNVNEAWTRMTKYTQMEVEGRELLSLLDGATEPNGRRNRTDALPYDLEDVTKGRCTCATRLHCDKDGKEFVDFISSYPLTNTNDEITHILHVSKELPPLQGSVLDDV